MQNLNDTPRVLGYFSKLFTPTQQAYSVCEREILALILSLKHWKPYVLDAKEPILVYTDHMAIKYLDKMADLSGRLARWSVFLRSFKLIISHRKGVDNGPPDFLSRKIVCSLQAEVMSPDTDYNLIILDIENWKSAQEKDDFCISVTNRIKDKVSKGEVDSQFMICPLENVLYRIISHYQLVVPRFMENYVIKLFHNGPTNGHYATKITLHKLQKQFWFPHMKQAVTKFVAACHICLSTRKTTIPKAPLVNMELPSAPMQIAHFDLFGPLTEDSRGQKYVVMMVDKFTKFVCMQTTATKTGEEIGEAMVNIFTQIGIPKVLISDNGLELTKGVFREATDLMGIQRKTITAYHPEANGQAERQFKDIGRYLSAYVMENQTDWSKGIQLAAFSHNTAFCRSTGETPFFAMFHRDPLWPLVDSIRLNQAFYSTRFPLNVFKTLKDTHNLISENLKQSQDKQSKYYNLKTQSDRIKEGDVVYLQRDLFDEKVSKKLQPKFLGPMRVLELIPPVNCRIRYIFPQNKNEQESRIVHINKLRPAPQELFPFGHLSPMTQDYLAKWTTADDTAPGDNSSGENQQDAPPPVNNTQRTVNDSDKGQTEGLPSRRLRSQGPADDHPWISDSKI